MIDYIKLGGNFLSFPAPDIKAPVVIQCSAQKDIDAVVRRLMLLKYFAGKGLSVRDAMRVSGHYIRNKEIFCLEVRSGLLSSKKNEAILYQVEIAAIPPDGFDASERIEIREGNNPVAAVERKRGYVHIEDRAGSRLHVIGPYCDKSVIFLIDDLPFVQFLGKFVEKWFFYLPVSTVPKLSLETFSDEVTDITPWLHCLLEQESNRDRIPRLVSFVHPCISISTKCGENETSANFALPETEEVLHRALDYAVGVVTSLLSDRISFVVLVKPERFIPTEKEKGFLEMVHEAMQNKRVLIITQSQTMSHLLPCYRYEAEDVEGELYLVWIDS